MAQWKCSIGLGFFCGFFLFGFYFFFLFLSHFCSSGSVLYGTCKSASSSGVTAAPGSVDLNTGLCRKDSSSRSSSYIKQRSVHGHSGSALRSSQGAVSQLPFLSLDVCLKNEIKYFNQEFQKRFLSSQNKDETRHSSWSRQNFHLNPFKKNQTQTNKKIFICLFGSKQTVNQNCKKIGIVLPKLWLALS